MLRSILNHIRNVLLFRVRYPWVVCGHSVHCQWSVVIGPRRRLDVTIGSFVGLGNNCLIACDTEIHNKVLIGSNVAFIGRRDHRFDIPGKAIWDSGRGAREKIIVEDDVWIGHGATVLSAVRLGRGAVVAAGSVVTKDVPRYTVVGGNPARALRMRFTEDQIREHEQTLRQHTHSPKSSPPGSREANR